MDFFSMSSDPSGATNTCVPLPSLTVEGWKDFLHLISAPHETPQHLTSYHITPVSVCIWRIQPVSKRREITQNGENSTKFRSPQCRLARCSGRPTWRGTRFRRICTFRWSLLWKNPRYSSKIHFFIVFTPVIHYNSSLVNNSDLLLSIMFRN